MLPVINFFEIRKLNDKIASLLVKLLNVIFIDYNYAIYIYRL